MIISVLLVDDHVGFRQSMRTYLKVKTSYTLSGEIGDAREAFFLTEFLQPDIVVLDHSMHVDKGLEIAGYCNNRCRKST
jgi:DNA-binding NarL/FixJ family response regulator